MVEALRSKRYRQTTRALYDQEGYCCLGVLTDIYLNENGYKTNGLSDEEYEALVLSYSEDKFGQLPNGDVMRWAGLNDQQGVDLAGMNDSGDDFIKISNFIEAQY